MPLSTIFQLYIVVFSFIREGNRSIWRKPHDLSQVTDKFSHIMLYRVHVAMSTFRTDSGDKY